MAKFLDQEGLGTLVGRVKELFDEKIDKPEGGEVGQVLVKTDEGVQWGTLIPGNPDGECDCQEATKGELDDIMGLTTEDGFDLEIGGSELKETYAVESTGTSYSIALTSDDNNYAITKVTPSEDWVTVDDKFTKLMVASRGIEPGPTRRCNVDIEVNNNYTKRMVVEQSENVETLSAPKDSKLGVKPGYIGPMEAHGGELSSEVIDKCRVNASYTTGETHVYEFDAFAPSDDPKFEIDTAQSGCTVTDRGLNLPPLGDLGAGQERKLYITMNWAEKNFKHTYNLEFYQEPDPDAVVGIMSTKPTDPEVII